MNRESFLRITIWALFGFVVSFGIIFLINIIVENENEIREYGDCLQIFADKYCDSLNHSRAIYWGNGFNRNMYFKCASERDYEGYGEFVSTQEENEYCEEFVLGLNDGEKVE